MTMIQTSTNITFLEHSDGSPGQWSIAWIRINDIELERVKQTDMMFRDDMSIIYVEHKRIQINY